MRSTFAIHDDDGGYVARVSERGLATKQAPFRSAEGLLRSELPELTWEDFEAGSRLAIADVEADPT